jgi:hypothetical protein
MPAMPELRPTRGICNCGDGFVPRPIRPSRNRNCDLGKDPTMKVKYGPVGPADHERFCGKLRDIAPARH